MRLALATLTVPLLLAVPTTVHAEDWLALYPECGFGPEVRALGRMAMIYPRPGLPAVVTAGERLVTRVRVPSGLTPPPGIQKDRALRGWSAELVGQSVALGSGGEHVYQTRVVDVRPDGQSTLVYRASIEVPRWAAPGTYGLRMSAPGGSDAVAGAVRILAPDAPLRMARLVEPLALAAADPSDAPESEAEDEALRRALAALTHAPVDVVVTDTDRLRGILESAGPTASLPALLIADDALPIVLRSDADTLLVFGECDDRYAPFDLQLDGLARRENRSPTPFADRALPTIPPAALVGPTLEPQPGSETLAIEAGDSPVEITVRYPDDGRGVRVDGAEPAFHPAVTIPMTGQVRTIAARLLLDAGERVTLARTAASPRTPPELHIRPERPVSGDEVRMRVDAEGLALVAWRLEEDITLVGPEVVHAYRPVGEERIHVFAISEDGAGQSLTETLVISTREVRGCGCGAAPTGPFGAPLADLWLIALVLLKMTGRRRNRIPSGRR